MNRQTVLITGASTGIGHATALHLAAAGYDLIAGVRREGDGQTLERSSGGRVTPVILDVTQPDHIERAVRLVRERSGDAGLKALVNNAGINHISPFELTDETRARQLFEVNFFGVCALTKALIPDLRRYAQGHRDTPKIVNIGSFGSTMGIPWEPYYHASKFALLGLSESLMFELRRQNIRVAAILPGGIRTDFFDKTALEIDRAIADLGPDERANYGHGLETLKRPFTQFKSMASSPELVARAIARTIAAQRPPFRRLVGADANAMFLMVRYLPTAWRQALLGPVFGA